MPRYYFDIRDGDKLVEDAEGIELSDVAAAREEAVAAARELLAEHLRHGELPETKQFEIRNEAGELIETVPFRTVFRRGQ
jgi:hypothetical protein